MRKAIFAVLMILFCQSVLTVGPARAQSASDAPADISLPAPSSTAQKIYDATRKDLLQVRVLLKNGRSQASVGSGFLVGDSQWVITNYHVVSQVVLEPKTYVAEFVDTQGERGELGVVAVDALRDLALARIKRSGGGSFAVPQKPPHLKQGQYLYSLGNPLDLGFAISEGAYNGVIKRGFYDQLMFTGPINSGMSGGPCVTVDGQLAGVNVSRRLDGELVSFLVPVRYVRELLDQAAKVKTPPDDFKEILARQLLDYQAVMIDRLTENPFSLKEMGPYRAPVRETDQMRCWGRSDARPDKVYTQDHVSCSMESSLYISDQLQTGWVSIRHTYTSAEKLNALRFSVLTENAFKEQIYGNHKDRHLTAHLCAEAFIQNGFLPLRAVICTRAYRKFAELYDFTVLTTSTDKSRMNLQSRLDMNGISYENGMKVARQFIESIQREDKP